MMKLRFSFFIILITQTTLWAGWHDRKAEGWAWYEKKKLPEEETIQLTDCLTSTQKMDQVRKQIEEKLATALLNPTAENIKNYMEEQQKWIERSSHFAQIWAKTLLNHPHLDYTATHMPISQYGLQNYKGEQQEEKERLSASLAHDYGLFFFYAGKSEVSSILLVSLRVLPKNMD